MNNNLDAILLAVSKMRKVDAEMPAQAMATLLSVANTDRPIRMTEIAEQLQVSQPTVSRNVAYFSATNRHKRKGHEMLEAYPDPEEHRRKLVKLTAKGRRFIKSLYNTKERANATT